MKLRQAFALALIVLALFAGTTGCYWKKQVESNEVGIVSQDGVSITGIVGAGRHSDMQNWYAELHILDASAKTVTWTDPSLLTNDAQPIGIDVSVTYRRPKSTEPDLVRTMWDDYRVEAKDDEALGALVLARIPEAVKSVTTQYTLYEMVGIAEGEEGKEEARQARQKTSFEMETNIQAELEDIGLYVMNVAINNIEPSASFAGTLEEMASANARLELAIRETARLGEALNQEIKQTEIDVEKARRENLVNEEMAKSFEKSDRAYELERLRLLKGVIGDADKIYFVPENADLTLILGGSGVVPID
jgi:regulator of protease activity HflC (stomatin/prohibitin superfamily)